MTQARGRKGAKLEEVLRGYFTSLGFFAVRGVPYAYAGIEITDVDVWVYSRPSPFLRQRMIVDAKNKASPKALERVLWVRGLRALLGVEGCLVATTDKRAEVRGFGAQHGVSILDGTFIKKLEDLRNREPRQRISEEELLADLGGKEANLSSASQWRTRLEASRGRLLSDLNFDGCNAWLDDVRFWMECVFVGPHRQVALRLTYIATSYLLIGLDYAMRTLVLDDADRRRTALEEGFRYGSQGRNGALKVIDTATTLVDTFVSQGAGVASQIRAQLTEQLGALPAVPLAEYFARQEVASSLFACACELDAAAYSPEALAPSQLSKGSKAALGILLDFHGLKRRKFFD